MRRKGLLRPTCCFQIVSHVIAPYTHSPWSLGVMRDARCVVPDASTHPPPLPGSSKQPPVETVLTVPGVVVMRDEMKGQNLSFIEIAKLVGERWQALPQSEKEPFETRALQAKERYSRELAEYRKTPEYGITPSTSRSSRRNKLPRTKVCSPLLTTFAHVDSSPGLLINRELKDPPKRAKVDAAATGSHAAHGSSSSVSRVAARDADGLPTRKQRLGSNVSQADAQFAVISTPPMSHDTSADDSMVSPRSASHFEPSEPTIPFAGTGGVLSHHSRSRSASLRELPAPLINPASSRHQLPPLSDMILDERIPNTASQVALPDASGFGYPTRPDPSFTSAGEGPRIASLRHNSSSTASFDSTLGSATCVGTNSSATSTTTSLSSSGGVSIHALLSSTAGPAPLQLAPKPSPPLPFVHRPTHGSTPPTSENGGFGAPGERSAGGTFAAVTAYQAYQGHADLLTKPVAGLANPSWPPALVAFGQHPSAARYSMSQSVSPVGEPVRMLSTSPTCSAPNASIPDGIGLGIEREPDRATGLDGMSALLKAGEIVERATP